MARRIRAKEAQVDILFNGTRLGRSLKKIKNLTITPDAEIVKENFVGETRANNDLDIRGYDFNWDNHVEDSEWWQGVWQQIQDAERLSEELPEITVAISFRFRDGRSYTVVLSDDLVMKLDTIELPDTGYVSTAWTGACQQAQGLP